MTIDGDEDPVNAFAKKMAEQLPVKRIYDDGLSSAVGETGGALTDIVKTVRLALAPFQLGAALQDRYRDFLDRSVRRVPEKDRVPPPPQVLGPALEGIRYEPEGTLIDEMFSELLSRSMDKKRANEAHPSYAFLIKQMSADEAKILRSLDGASFDYVYTSDLDQATNTFRNRTVEKDVLSLKAELDFPENLGFYIDHLNSHGLAGIYQQGDQEPIMAGGQQTGVRVRNKFRLSELGQRFVTACMTKQA
jgi:hypothetical protein